MRKWAEISADPNFINEPDDVKQQVANQYYQQLLSDPQFANEPEEVKMSVRQKIGIVEPTVKDEYAPGEIITSEPISKEEQAKEKGFDYFRKGLDLMRMASEDPNSIKQADEFSLLEAFSQARQIKNRKAGSLLYKELKSRGIPDEYMEMYNQLGKDEGFFESLKDPESITRGVGGIVGSVAGAALTKTPQGAKVGASIGAGIGGGLAELAVEGKRRILEPERARGGLELAKDVGKTAATEAIGEAGGRYVIDPLLGKVARRFAGDVIDDAPRLSKELVDASQNITERPGMTGSNIPVKKKGLAGKIEGLNPLAGTAVSAELTAAQQANSRTLGLAENILETTILGGHDLHIRKEIVQPAALKQFVSNKVDDFTRKLSRQLDLDDLGKLVQDTIHGTGVPEEGATRSTSEAFHEMSSKFYDVVDRVAQTKNKVAKEVVQKQSPILDESGKNIVTQSVKKSLVLDPVSSVDMGPLKNYANNILQKVSKGKQFMPDSPIKSYLNDVMKIQDKLTFKEAHQIRSKLLLYARELEGSGSAEAKAIGKNLSTIVDKQMEATAKRIGPEALNVWREANEFYKNGSEMFNAGIIRKLTSDRLKENPELVLNSIFGKTRDEVRTPLSRIRNVKNALLADYGQTSAEKEASQAAWDQLRWNWLASEINSATDLNGVIKGESFEKALQGIGKKGLSEMFSSAELRGIEDISKLARLVQKKNPTLGPIFNNILRLGQVGGTVGAASAGKESIAISLLGGPVVLAKAMTSEKGIKLLTTGFKTGKASGITGQFIALMVEEKKRYDKEQKKLEKFERQMESKQNMRTSGLGQYTADEMSSMGTFK